MKPLRALTHAPEGIRRYREDLSKTQTWGAFRDDGDGRTAYEELSSALVASQLHLCCYCEIDLIVPLDRQIEHVQSRHKYKHRELDPTNMLASCQGGSNLALSADVDRYLPERDDSLSCGQKKDREDTLDPRALPTGRSVFVVTAEGRLIVDPDACKAQGILVAEANNAIVTLGLDVPRLVKAREKIMRALAAYSDIDMVLLEIEARRQLLPDTAGKLMPWFTTRRSFFGAIAETILATPPQEWLGI